MPNWCFTNITIIHHDKERLDGFERLLNLWTSSNAMENGFGLDWLGNIVLNSEVGTVDTGKDTDLRCRGTVDSICNDGDQIVIQTTTAWRPMMKMWKKVVDKYLPGAALIYSASEEGNAFFVTNDEDLRGCYVIDAYDMEDIESDWEAEESEVISILQKILNIKETDIEKLLADFEESEASENMSIHAWDFDDDEQFEY